MCENFPGGSFPDTVLTIDLKHYYYYSWGFIESWKKDKKGLETTVLKNEGI